MKPYLSTLALALLLAACGTNPSTQRPGSISGLVISPGGNVGGQAALEPALNLPILPNVLTARRLPQVSSIKAGEVVVKLKPSLRLQSLDRLSVAGAELDFVRPTAVERAGLYRVSGLDEAATVALARQLAARTDVEYAEPNTIEYALKTPNDEFYGAQWHYPLINMPAAWDITVGSANVVVAVIDTGIVKHPDLDANVLPGYDFISDPASAGDGDGRDDNPNDDSAADASFHGSHVAGTVAAVSNNNTGVAGVSWNSKILPLRGLGIRGSGSGTDIADAIVWAAGGSVQGVPNNPTPAQIINMSLGGKGECVAFYRDAINQATALGAIVVVAAGNENDDTSLYRPASCPNTITVGAVGPQGKRAPYSNYGSQIDIMAPGGDTTQRIEFDGRSFAAGVLSTVSSARGPAYSFLAGTSMASPHVAGIVALMKAQNPSLNYATALAKLQASARPMDATACNRPQAAECGPGLIDVAKAVAGGGTTPPPPPGPPPPPAQPIDTLVVAFYCTTLTCYDNQGELAVDLNKSRAITVKLSSLRTPYSMTNLSPASYLAAGWQDLNDNDQVDDNEPLGVYPGQVFVDPASRVRNVDIELKPLEVNSQAVTGGEGSLRQALREWVRNRR
jgi:serine protease